MRRISAYSPLRVSFSGGGTDINPFLEKYGTNVVNTAIDRGVYVTYTEDMQPLEISSRHNVKTIIFGDSEDESFQDSMVRFLTEYGIKTGRLYINGEVPPGSGLGSSSAMMTALIRVLKEIRNEYDGPENLAREAYLAERDSFGITLGIQDPYAIAFGGFKSMESMGMEPNFSLFNDTEVMDKLSAGMIICYTGNTRESSAVLRDQVEKAQKGENDTIDKLVRMKQIAQSMKKAVEDNDWHRFNELVNSGWTIKKSLGTKVSGKNIDFIVNIAIESGALSARLLGGGSEGFVLALCDRDKLWSVQQSLKKISKFVMRVSPVVKGTELFTF